MMTTPCPHCGTELMVHLMEPPVAPPMPPPVPPVVVPPAPPPVVPPVGTLGVPFGPTQLPIAELGKLYTGTVLNANAATLLKDLETVRAQKSRVILAMRRSTLQDAKGLSVTAAAAELKSWPNIMPFVVDGTVLAIYAADDISKDEWGPYTPIQRAAMWSEIYGLIKGHWTAPTIARAKPGELEGFKNVDLAWAAYKGPYRDGPAEKYRDNQLQTMKAMGFKGMVIWPNALDGGDGSSKILGTYENAAAVHRFQCSGAEMLAYGLVFLPVTFAAFHWRWSPTYTSSKIDAAQLAGVQAFETRPDVVVAMKRLREAAAATPRPVLAA